MLCCFGVHCLDLVLECWQVAVIFVSDFFESVFSKSNRTKTKTNKQTNKQNPVKTRQTPDWEQISKQKPNENNNNNIKTICVQEICGLGPEAGESTEHEGLGETEEFLYGKTLEETEEFLL